MERMRFRSTSLAHMLAEIHQADLLAEAERHRRVHRPTGRRSFFGLSIPGRRRLD